MILAIDIGNTTVTLGGVRTAPQQAYSLEFTARIDINHTWSASQYESAIEQLFEDKNLSPSDFRGVIISSVVPSVLTLLQECVRNLFGTEPLLVTSESDLGMTFSIPEPEKVGRDRLVDAAWAAAHYPLPVITVDLGTATTFNVVDENRVFRGGVICPGLSTGLRALGERCAQLPQVRLSSPKAAIGVNTESCMLSGSVLGTAVLLDGITQRIEEELGRPATLVVTGGLAKYVTPLCRHPLTYDPELLLKGLALLYQMNAPQPHYAAGGRRRNPNNNFRRGRRPRSQRRERREEKNKNG